MSQVTGKTKVKKGDLRKISRRGRCAYVAESGRRCKQKAWRGKEVCYQHDPEAAELRGNAGRPRDPMYLVSVKAVQLSLTDTLEDLRAGRIKAGEAYAAGYLAQLALTALDVDRRERKLDVKHFWEMVDLGATIEDAVKLAKERKKEKEAQEAKEAQETQSFGFAQDKEAKEAEEERRENADPSPAAAGSG